MVLFFLFGFISISIPIPVSVAFAVTIFLTVSITIAVFTFTHINTVNDSSQFRELMFVFQYIDVFIAGLWSHIRTADVHTHISYAANDGGIGHHTDRGGIQNDVIVTGFQQVDGMIQYVAGYQFGGVGRHGATGQDVQVRADVGTLDHVKQVDIVRIAQVVGDTFGPAAQVEHLVQTGFADVHTYHDDFLAQEGQGYGGITCHEGFSFARLGRREEDYLVGLAQHEEEVGTQTAEGLFHDVVLVLAHHDGSVFGLGALGQFGQDAHAGDAFHIVPVLNLVFQQIAQVHKTYRNSQSNDKGSQGYHFLFRRNRILVRQSFFDDAAVGGGSGQGDGVLFPLLKQHDVELGLDFLLAGDAQEFLFLLRRAADAAFELPGLAFDVGLGNLESFQHAGYRGLYVVTGRLDAGIHVDNGRVILRRGAEQAFPLNQQGVVLVDDLAQILVLQADIDRDDFVRVGGIVDVVAQEFHQADLGLVLDAQLLVLGVFFQGQFGIAGQVRQTGFLLEVRQLGFGAAQFLVDDANAVFDEFGRLHGHFVFLVVGVLVVVGHQAVDEVDGSLAAGVLEGYLSDGGRFGGGSNRQVFAVGLGYCGGGIDVANQLQGAGVGFSPGV